MATIFLKNVVDSSQKLLWLVNNISILEMNPLPFENVNRFPNTKFLRIVFNCSSFVKETVGTLEKIWSWLKTYLCYCQ